MIMRWLLVGLRNVLRYRRRTLLLLTTVIVGTTAILLALGYIEETFLAIRENAINSGTGHLQIAMPGEFDRTPIRTMEFGMPPSERQHVEARLRTMKDIRLVVPWLGFTGLISTGTLTEVFVGAGVEPEIETRVFRAINPIVAGKGLSRSGTNPYRIVLGQELARRLGVTVGGNVTLLVSTAQGGYNAIDLDVVGIISSGIPDIDLRSVAVPLETAQELIGTDKVSRLIVLLQQTELTEAAVANVSASLPEVAVRSWLQLSPLYQQVYDLYSRQFAFLGVVIVIVVFLSVTNIMSIIVTERTREIGTMRAIGIPAGLLRLLLTYEASIIGLAGGLLGTLLSGLLFALADVVDIEMPAPPGQSRGFPLRLLWSTPGALATIAGMCLVCGGAAWLASRRASVINIVRALSHV